MIYFPDFCQLVLERFRESESEEEAPARRSRRAAAIRGNQALQCINVRPLRVYGQWVPRRLAGASRD